MATPSFLAPLKDVVPPSIRRRAASATAASGAPPGALAFEIQVQEKDNWCWAAVAASVADYFAQVDHTPALSQDDVAARVGVDDDEPYLLSAALDKIGHLAGAPIEGALVFADIKTEIQNGKPICCEVSWSDNSEGHYIVMMGCHDDANQDVIVLDPAETAPHCGAFPLRDFEKFVGGSWLNTCRTA